MNTNPVGVDIKIDGEKQGVIGGRQYNRMLHLDAYDVELPQ